MRSKIWPIMFMGLLALSVLVVDEVPLAQAQNTSLRGDYNFTFTRTCSQAAVSGSSNPVGPFVLTGVVHFDGAGGGSLSGRQFLLGTAFNGTVGAGIDDGNGSEFFIPQADITSCGVTYSVSANGSFSQTMNSCILTFQTGGGTIFEGNTASLSGLTISGTLNLDGNVLVLDSSLSVEPATDVETFTWTSGPNSGIASKRICKGAGLATSQR
ncbi:MAG: hypothetical protein OEY91_15275 [Nitrospirota bacterium]|nr:hypothetical protein [Nitrospirota bacterium]